MKEATGELSMTAVVVVVIGILAVALPMIINSVVNSMERSANCSAAFGCDASSCKVNGGSETTMKCIYIPDEGANAGKDTEITCPCDTSFTK